MAWQRGFGVRDAATKAPVTSDVMFEAASMSKPVFAYVVMKLCESGVMSLDAPLTKYTPERFLAGDRAGRDHRPARAVTHERLPELALGEDAAGDSLRARNAVSLLGRRLQLSADRRDAPARRALRVLHARRDCSRRLA